MVLWMLCELAIVACDLAELLGAAIALKLLFGLPLVWGVSLVGLEVLLLLGLRRRNIRPLEALVVGLMVVIGSCFAIELVLAQPPQGLIPGAHLVSDPAMLYVAIGILGATIMPHNLYLHSSIVQSRQYERSEQGLRHAIRFSRLDVIGALIVATFVNGAILVLAASTFHGKDWARSASRMPTSSSRLRLAPVLRVRCSPWLSWRPDRTPPSPVRLPARS
jgi:manganese transport protein